jgi:hypothetical protein
MSTRMPKRVSHALTPDSASASSAAPAPPARDVLKVGTPPDWYEITCCDGNHARCVVGLEVEAEAEGALLYEGSSGGGVC